MDARDRLVSLGLILFLLSLLTGLLLAAGPSFVANPRGVLAGHLEAAMNGMFLILVGLLSSRIQLSASAWRVCLGALVYSAYANWFFTTLSGILGASDATPIAGAGHRAGPAIEQFITLGLVSVALTMLVAVVLLIVGVRARGGASAAAAAA